MLHLDPRQEIEDITSLESIMLDDLESPIVKLGAEYWRALRGIRRYPSRKDLHPRDVASVLGNMVLVKVIDGGNDFEYRIVGEVQAQAYGYRLQGRRISQIAAERPAYGHSVRGAYRRICESGEPVAVRGYIGSDFAHLKFAYCEHIALPLGATDDAVDHILIFSTYVARASADGKK
jgi:hypothetical protein